MRRLRRKLGDDAGDPAYIFTRRRAGYWIEKGETLGPEGTDHFSVSARLGSWGRSGDRMTESSGT